MGKINAHNKIVTENPKKREKMGLDKLFVFHQNSKKNVWIGINGLHS